MVTNIVGQQFHSCMDGVLLGLLTALSRLVTLASIGTIGLSGKDIENRRRIIFWNGLLYTLQDVFFRTRCLEWVLIPDLQKEREGSEHVWHTRRPSGVRESLSFGTAFFCS